ncbi:MAG TPA: trigger factor [Streptosporangiaceae bacterium]
MKTAVEELGPTRVKLTVEVPFEELQPSLDKAYREVSRQVRVPGFRPGRVPPRIIDQRFGRGLVLDQAVNEALPELYGKALDEGEVFALGQPELEITKLDDGKELTFTAEVDIRPRFEIPDIEGMPVTVENAVVTPDDVEEYLNGLRERFASLKGVDRPAQAGDFVSIDLSASLDGEPVEDAQASGLSYEIGSGTLLDGLDDALDGVTAGESKTFTAELPGGAHTGEQAEVTVTVHSVKVKALPELDDEFAQSASEFDTLGEWRAGTRTLLEDARRGQQLNQARERALDALLQKIDIPLPEAIVTEEADRQRRSLGEQVQQLGTTLGEYLQALGRSPEEFEADLQNDARRSVKTGFVLDQFALEEKLGVDAGELSAYIADQAQRMRVDPNRLARELTENNQLGSVAADVLRTKALGLVAQRAKVTDEAGNDVEIAPSAAEGSAAEDTGTDDAADADAEQAETVSS